MSPRELLAQLFLDEYFFTFLATALSVVFKALSMRQSNFFQKRNTYDLGIELVFIAVSFVLSQLAQVVDSEQSIKNELELMLSRYKLLAADGLVMSDSAQLLLEQSQKWEQKMTQLSVIQQSLYLVISSLAAYLIMLVIYMRKYALDSEGEVHLFRGIVIPNLLGVLAIILSLSVGG